MAASLLSLGFAIPTYRNADSLAACLRSIAKWEAPAAGAVVVVDDSGTGAVAAALRNQFPDVHWVVHERNLGFGAAASRAVIENPRAIVVLLNDDAELSTAVTEPLAEWFADSSLFAVTFRSTLRDGSFREGAKRLIWRAGIPKILHNPRDQRSPERGRVVSDYAVGGHCAVRREYFAALGGFDELFAPFYWEDVDLCVRARAWGWGTVYDERCAVIHDGSSAIRAHFEQEQIGRIVWRNRILFARRHARGVSRLLLRAGLPVQRLVSALRGDRAFAEGLREANSRGC